MSDRVEFTCNGRRVSIDADQGESLMTVLRERLGLMSVKDGCAPQGQCGCCTVLVDGAPRVSCVTPAARVVGRAVVTVEGLEPEIRDSLAAAFVASGGSQCGFCTPGIVMRTQGLVHGGVPRDSDIDRALAAHLCRCTGWVTVREAVADAAGGASSPAPRHPGAAARRAELEGGVAQRVDPSVPLGEGAFADDGAPHDALVAVPCPSEQQVAGAIEAAGRWWVVAESLREARAATGRAQGRRTTRAVGPPLPLPAVPPGGVRLATSWVEPAYLEPDASWCVPGGQPASALANGGAFGGKHDSPAPAAAHELADRLGRAVRVVFAREDVVRLGPKRPPIAASAVIRDGVLAIDGLVAGDPAPFLAVAGGTVAELPVTRAWARHDVPGPHTSPALRAVGLAENAVLAAGAIVAAGLDAAALVHDPRAARVALDSCVAAPSGALAGARVDCAANGTIARVEIRVAAGDPLDEVVLRSYAIGAAHMALGWVLTEGLAVDPETGEPLDLTIRSFGVISAARTPPIEVVIVDDDGPPLARSSDAVFAAVAAATWNAVSASEQSRPETFPARDTAASRALRR